MSAADNDLRCRIEEVKLTAPALLPGAGPLRLAHLSDLHLRSWRPRYGRLAEAVNARRPDFVFLTGDLISGWKRTWDALERFLRALQAPCGVFACRGNWEVKNGRGLAHLRRLLAASGAQLLVNESREVRAGAGLVRVSGLDDLVLGWPDFDVIAKNGSEAAYNIVLCHAPLAARFVTPEMGVDLMLSGHTHGGQIRIPLVWRFALPRCHGGYADGLFREKWGNLYVSRGYGGGGWMEVRFRCPAEVAFFEVSAGAAAQA
jgi:predicted MPP superfamily phosphohydrolase